jgi:tetratricopeptide (TPR) repeat protein
VEAAIRGMRDGTVDPDTIKIEGIDTDEEIAEKARAKAKRLADIKERNDALASERKKEEHRRWWDGVEVMVPLQETSTVTIEKSEEEEKAETFHQLRYTSNYSRWNDWTPADPATKMEAAEIASLEDKKRNEEFENANKDFCGKYMDDMNAREKEKNKKIAGADANRLRGNNYFKHKKFEDAHKCYMEALKDQPFDAKILINIAQVHIKWEATEDALEFLARVLRVDAKHTKALSRMAYVLSTQNRIDEGLEYAKKALATDPGSNDIQRQVVELELAVKTAKDEAAINVLKTKACGGMTADETALLDRSVRDTASAAGGGPEAAMRQLEEALKMPMLATGFELIDSFVAAGKLAATDTSIETDLITKCIQLLKVDDNMRVYFRTSKALQMSLTKLRELGTALLDESTAQADRSGLVGAATEYLQLLRASVTGEPANMAATTVYSPDIIVFLVSLLQADFALSVEILEFINLFFDESHSTSLGVLLNYKSVLLKISEYLQFSTASTALQKNKTLLVSCLHFGLQFVRSYLFNDVVKSTKFVFPLNKSSGAALVENLAIALQTLMCAEDNVENVIESNLEALLGCSQYSILRGAFGNSVRAINLPMTVPCPTTLHVIALLSTETYRRVSYLPLCLGILMNICVADDEESQGAMRDKIVQSGCLELVVDIVTMPPDKRAATDTLVLARAAGLLARLTASPLAAETVKDPVLYAKLCRRLAENIALPNREEKWITDECGYLVRVIATVPNVPQQCLDVALAEKLVESILKIFPTPRLEMGDITPHSVVLPPTVPVPAILVGNAARCLVPLADDAKNSAVLFKEASKQGVEKLICALANCTDMRVRKNIAILLAKGAKVPEVRAKIEKFRGMQMLVELQKSL